MLRSQRNNRKTWKWTTLKRVRIRPKYSATVASLSRDWRIKMKWNKTNEQASISLKINVLPAQLAAVML